MTKKLVLFYLISIFFLACQTKNNTAIDTKNLAQDITALSADSMLGRPISGIGAERTLNYLQKRMQDIGLEPAFEGSYLQKVPLVMLYSRMTEPVGIHSPAGENRFEPYTDFSLWGTQAKPLTELKNSPMVFMGFGVNSPENHWNDFKNIDVKGKTIVVLVNDPGFYTNDTIFKGKAMTYYGRWRYKFEEAERQGAAACIIVHEEDGAGYPWGVASKDSTKPNVYVEEMLVKPAKCAVQGWMTSQTARKLFSLSGLDYDKLKIAANKQGFKPVPLKTTLNTVIANRWKKVTSYNVAGILKGAKHPDEAVVYSAHWDHLGVGKSINGDSIYNGASDNAAAMAWLLDIAAKFKTKPAPERSVLFLIPTAEEAGLLGSQYYVEHPVLPMNKTVACINTDVILFLGKFKDVTITGIGHSDLDKYVEEFAKKQNRYVANDPNPENGMIFRSDQLPFMQHGVPSIFAKGYTEQRELGKEKTIQKIKEYWKNTYHKPSDEFDPKRDNLEGLAEDAVLFFNIGNKLANERSFPQWHKSSEFYKKR